VGVVAAFDPFRRVSQRSLRLALLLFSAFGREHVESRREPTSVETCATALLCFRHQRREFAGEQC